MMLDENKLAKSLLWLMAICAVLGWLVIEIAIYLFSHISISWTP